MMAHTVKKAMNLYWVTTDQHEEDWFILASNPEDAARFHEDAEGYDVGDAVAEFVLEIPEGIAAEEGWPSHELLESIGGIFISKGAARVVEINGRTYAEGLMEETLRTLDDDIAESKGKGRIHKTKRQRIQ